MTTNSEILAKLDQLTSIVSELKVDKDIRDQEKSVRLDSMLDVICSTFKEKNSTVDEMVTVLEIARQRIVDLYISKYNLSDAPPTPLGEQYVHTEHSTVLESKPTIIKR